MTSFEEYIDQYGPHFNKKLYEWAVSMMTDRNGNKVPAMAKEQVESWLANLGVKIKNNKGWDIPYARAMLFSDYWGNAITTDQQLAYAVADYLDDQDGNPTKPFDHFVVDCRVKSEPIFWDDFL